MQYAYPAEYEDAQAQFDGADSAIQQGIERFRATYGELTSPELGDRVSQLYADEFYFNDTFKTLRTREELVDYLSETGERLKASEVTIENVLTDGSDVFIRWTMNMSFSAVGRDIESRSIGISHLRFNDEGRIILHQDFWDGAHGFYRHIPVVGGLMEWVRKRM
ncbi:MAG: nuclear transport factor 2 family protein [Wenzhouxiangellaceae bacterium]